MHKYGGVDIYISVLLTTTQFEGEGLASLLGFFTPRESASGSHWTGGCVNVVDVVGNTGTRTPTLLSSSPQPVGILTALSRHMNSKPFCEWRQCFHLMITQFHHAGTVNEKALILQLCGMASTGTIFAAAI
jgi:hypothetical protein